MMDSNSTKPMEKPHFETLAVPPESSIRFRRHRRSHLKSETYRTLVQILSHCYDYSQCSLPTSIVHDTPQLDNGNDELGDETGKEVCDELVACDDMEREETGKEDELVACDNMEREETGKEVCDELAGCDNMERDNVPMQEDMVVDESANANDIEGGGSNQVQMVLDELENMMNLEENKGLVDGNSTFLTASSVDINNTDNEIVEFVDSQENYLALKQFLEELGDVEKLPVENDGLHSLSKDVELSFDKGIVMGVFEEGSNGEDKMCEDKVSSFEPDRLEQHELQQKDNELEKSVCITNKMVSPISKDGNEEMEEGEIYGDLGLYDQSIELPEDSVALEEEKVDREQISEDVMIKEMISSREQKRRDEQDTVSSLHTLDTADVIVNSIENEVSNKFDMECKMAVPGRRFPDEKAYGYNWMPEAGRSENQDDGLKVVLNCLKTCPGDITLHRNSSEKNANKNGGIASTNKDAGVINKKKRSGSSERRKEKAKRRKKLKRAEENRRLGVKRLKLQPVLKPKVKKTCEHYLKGRCRKGDQCSFSHDAVPLTKSTPCSHFARKSCMKGDDCPFDHELSKYPCDNFVSKGACIRGDACMFSHKVSVKDGSLTPSNVCKLESTSPFLPGSSDSKKQLNTNAPRNMDTRVYPCKITNQNVAETILKPPAHPPKGIRFLSFGNSPLNDSCKLKQGGSSPKGNYIKVGNQINPSALSAVQSLNEVQKISPPAVAPKGINLSSFGKAPVDDFSSKKEAALPSNSENRSVMPPLNNSSKIKQDDSALKRAFCFGNRHEHSASETIQNKHEMPKRDSPALATPGINPFSLCKDPSDDSSIKQQTSLPINKISITQRQSASGKNQFPSAMPSMLPVSPLLSSGQSSGRLSDGHKNMASSRQTALLTTLAFAAMYESELKMK